MKVKKILIALIIFLSAASVVRAQALASYGITNYTFLTFTNATGNGTAFAIPQASMAYVTYCTSFGTAPASITFNMQVSIDNSSYSTIDSSTSTAGECRSFFTAAKFVRGNISAISGGTTTTVAFNTQRVNNSSNGTGNTFIQSVSRILVQDGTAALPSITFANESNSGLYRSTAGIWRLQILGSTSLEINSVNGIGIGGNDLFITRDAANTLAQRNGTNAQTFNLYGSFTDVNNYERGQIYTDASGLNIRHRGLGTGSSRAINFDAYWRVTTVGNFVGVTPTVGLGYATGAGGAVTQLTSKATGVTLNTITGEITLNAAALAANTAVSFTLTDSAIALNDYVLCQRVSAGTAGAYNCEALAAAGSATITITNRTAGSLSEAPVIKFMVFKSAVS